MYQSLRKLCENNSFTVTYNHNTSRLNLLKIDIFIHLLLITIEQKPRPHNFFYFRSSSCIPSFVLCISMFLLTKKKHVLV